MKPAPSPKGNSPGRKRVSRRLVVLSSAAIAAVYATGLGLSQSASEQVATASQIAPTHPAPALTPVPAPAAALPPTTSSTGSSLAAASSAPSSAYQDGTYSGTGYNRHGEIQVNVTIHSGKISGASVTSYRMRYPFSDISGLPGEVLAAQSPQVDMVSGATDSSMAYLDAVQNALSKAQSGA